MADYFFENSHRRRRGAGFVLPELLAALLIFGIALLGAASLHGSLLRHQQSLQRDAAALRMAQELDERRRAQPQFSCAALSEQPGQPGLFRIDGEEALSWSDALRQALPAVQYRLSETGGGCRVELDYLHSDAQRRRLLWE